VATMTWVEPRPPRFLPDDVDGRLLFDVVSARAATLDKGEQDKGGVGGLGAFVMVPPLQEARARGVRRPATVPAAHPRRRRVAERTATASRCRRVVHRPTSRARPPDPTEPTRSNATASSTAQKRSMLPALSARLRQLDRISPSDPHWSRPHHQPRRRDSDGQQRSCSAVACDPCPPAGTVPPMNRTPEPTDATVRMDQSPMLVFVGGAAVGVLGGLVGLGGAAL